MKESLAVALGTPELLIILIVGLMVLGGLLLLLNVTLPIVKRAADRSAAADRDSQPTRDAGR